MSFSYTRFFSDEEEMFLRDRIANGDPIDWVGHSVEDKLNVSIKDGASRRRNELIKSGASSMPVKDIDVMREAISAPGYKNAKKRDEESQPKK